MKDEVYIDAKSKAHGKLKQHQVLGDKNKTGGQGILFFLVGCMVTLLGWGHLL
ncbi:hypothetical protein HanIR_Chr17g0858841 [Helianthus annuus]|nr:hypothetical protein HanIR_Chr17g0858841 [Helianthus annuus]